MSNKGILLAVVAVYAGALRLSLRGSGRAEGKSYRSSQPAYERSPHWYQGGSGPSACADTRLALPTPSRGLV